MPTPPQPQCEMTTVFANELAEGADNHGWSNTSLVHASVYLEDLFGPQGEFNGTHNIRFYCDGTDAIEGWKCYVCWKLRVYKATNPNGGPNYNWVELTPTEYGNLNFPNGRTGLIEGDCVCGATPSCKNEKSVTVSFKDVTHNILGSGRFRATMYYGNYDNITGDCLDPFIGCDWISGIQ